MVEERQPPEVRFLEYSFLPCNLLSQTLGDCAILLLRQNIKRYKTKHGTHALLVWESAALSPSPASLGALGGVLSGRLMSLGQVLRAGSAWFITTLSAALRLLSQSHAETASSAKKTLRHRVVCRIRVTSESVFDFIDSSFQSNIGALLEHGTV